MLKEFEYNFKWPLAVTLLKATMDNLPQIFKVQLNKRKQERSNCEQTYVLGL